MKHLRPICHAACLAIIPALFAPATAVPLLPHFSSGAFAPGAPINHEYFPLLPGQADVLVAQGIDEDGETFSERTERSYRRGGPTIMGVQVTTFLDRAYEDDLLVEETYDYFAQDRAGNVWYMGEDVTNFRYDDDDNLIGTDDESAWRAGIRGAQPGWIMPAEHRSGEAYFQEHAPKDEALDFAYTIDVLDSLEVGGIVYDSVLRVFEGTTLDPSTREIKYYAPGIGLIRDAEDLDSNLANPELVFNRVAPVPIPLPATLLIGGLAALAGLRGRKRLFRSTRPLTG